MLNRLKRKYQLILLIFLLSGNIYPQWQHAQQLTNNQYLSYLAVNNVKSIAANGNNVHLTWFDERDGNSEIYYKRSTNNGLSWGSDTRLTNAAGPSENPGLVVSGQDVYIVWNDNRDGNGEIYFKRSSDGGNNWLPDIRLTNSTSVSIYPAIAVNGSVLHITWQDGRDGNDEIYYKRSTAKGQTWSNDTRLTNNLFLSWTPEISVIGETLNIFFDDNRAGVINVFNKRSTNGGLTWGTDTQLTTSPHIAQNTSSSVTGETIYITYREYFIGSNTEIFVKRSLNSGATWGPAVRITNDPEESISPSIAVLGSNVHLIWWDRRDSNWEMYNRRSTDGGLNWGNEIRLTHTPSNSYYPSIAVSGSTVHAVWCDDFTGNFEIYYMRDTVGNPIGIQTISNEIPSQFSLSQNYPNPFNPETKINFSLPVNGNVKLEIFDIQGRAVITLVNSELKAGVYSVSWHAADVPSGTYFYRIQGVDFTETKKMVLIK